MIARGSRRRVRLVHTTARGRALEVADVKLKTLEICGFKSFVGRPGVRFDHDITGVGGPNGCGKSNIVDAIRWSMGEQSARLLRGRGMEDVIFNGSETRRPYGMAEV